MYETSEKENHIKNNNKKPDSIQTSIGGNVQGNVIGGNNDGKVITTINTQKQEKPTVIGIDKSILGNMPKEYSDSLEKLCNIINSTLQTEKIDLKKIDLANNNLDQLAKELSENTNEGEIKPSGSKKRSIAAKIATSLESLIDISPRIIETISSSIPILSPFSKIIGESMENIIEEIRK
jgi:hypothetical protein